MNKFFFIKSGKSIIKLNANDIVLVQSWGNYIQIHTTNGAKYVHYKSLKATLDTLPDEFMRVHNSFIVNLNHIHKIEDNHIYIKDHKVPVSSANRNCLYNRIDQYKL